MPNKRYEINFGESSSPLRIYDSAGRVVFDANYATLCILGVFAVTVPNNASYGQPYDPSDGTSGYVRAYFPRALVRPPYHSPLYLQPGTGMWTVCGTSFSDSVHSPGGLFATAFTDSIIFANYDFAKGYKMSAIVFENGVRG